MSRLLFFAADDSSERDLVAFNITSSQAWTLYNDNSSSIRLTVDRLNQIIYWISYNADGSLILRKTDYSGNTTVITSSFGHSGRPAITQIGGYYYVLDSTQSIIRKYDKSTDEVVQNITVYDGAAEIIGTNGKTVNDGRGLAIRVSLKMAAKLSIQATYLIVDWIYVASMDIECEAYLCMQILLPETTEPA